MKTFQLLFTKFVKVLKSVQCSHLVLEVGYWLLAEDFCLISKVLTEIVPWRYNVAKLALDILFNLYKPGIFHINYKYESDWVEIG